LDVYAVVGEASVQGLDAGLYHYLPSQHGLEQIAPADLREQVASACLGQTWMAPAPVSLVLTAEYGRIEGKYGSRGRRYALIEVGHAAQNIFLQAESLGLGAGIVGAFDEAGLARTLHLPRTREPLIVMPVGHRRTR
jgi:SagB-type dehydrogenase family enzyme